MSLREKVWSGIKWALIAALLVTVVWQDISLQMQFTEDSRNGVYEAAYQRSLKGGAP